MPSLKEYSFGLLKSTAGVDANTTGATLYTVPPGKTGFVVAVNFHSPTTSLQGTTDCDLTNWRTEIDLSGITATSMWKLEYSNNLVLSYLPAGTNFDITFNSTGPGKSVTFTADVFGYLT